MLLLQVLVVGRLMQTNAHQEKARALVAKLQLVNPHYQDGSGVYGCDKAHWEQSMLAVFTSNRDAPQSCPFCGETPEVETGPCWVGWCWEAAVKAVIPNHGDGPVLNDAMLLCDLHCQEAQAIYTAGVSLRSMMMHTVWCTNCEHAPAMIDRMPGKQSNYLIHRLCWPCARQFHAGFTPAEVAHGALRGWLG